MLYRSKSNTDISVNLDFVRMLTVKKSESGRKWRLIAALDDGSEVVLATESSRRAIDEIHNEILGRDRFRRVVIEGGELNMYQC